MKRKTIKKTKTKPSKVFTSWIEFNKWLIATDYNIAKPLVANSSGGGISNVTIILQ